jgi:probable F420-dependent oxidoreductase
VVLAKEAATLDVLSGGRFELGLGSGWLREEYDQAGILFDAPGTRIERMAEAVTLVKGLLTGEPVHFTGRHYTIAGLRGTPTPIQRPHPPLVIGGGGQRLLSLAAREASIVSLVPRARRDGGGLDRGDFGEAAFRQKIEWVRAAAGDRLAALELHTLIQAVVVTDRRAIAAEQLATRFKIGPELVLESPYVLCGTVEEICETLRQRRQTHGISYVTVFDRDLEVFAPVVERLAAT